MNKESLALEMTKYPLRFSQHVFFGVTNDVPDHEVVSNGSAALIEMNGKMLAITCSHVLNGYRSKKAKDSETIFQIGNLKINPEDLIISENTYLDLAVLDLTEQEVSKLHDHEVIGSAFFNPVYWPPGDVKVGDFIMFGGFPGVWREHGDKNTLSFGTYSSGGCEVHSVSEEHIVCRIELDKCLLVINNENPDEKDLGGISGGPAFIMRSLYSEYIGNIYEYSESLDLLYIRKSKFIDKTGLILA